MDIYREGIEIRPLAHGTAREIAFLVASGAGEKLRTYIGYSYPRRAPLACLREQMEAMFDERFMAMAYNVAPWLRAERWQGDDLVVECALAALNTAGREGLPLSQLRSTKISDRQLDVLVEEGRIVRDTVATKGRAATRFWHADHAAGIEAGARSNLWHDVVSPEARARYAAWYPSSEASA